MTLELSIDNLFDGELPLYVSGTDAGLGAGLSAGLGSANQHQPVVIRVADPFKLSFEAKYKLSYSQVAKRCMVDSVSACCNGANCC